MILTAYFDHGFKTAHRVSVKGKSRLFFPVLPVPPKRTCLPHGSAGCNDSSIWLIWGWGVWEDTGLPGQPTAGRGCHGGNQGNLGHYISQHKHGTGMIADGQQVFPLLNRGSLPWSRKVAEWSWHPWDNYHTARSSGRSCPWSRQGQDA